MDLRDRSLIARVILLGLDQVLASELESVLRAQRHVVLAEPFHPPAECLRVLSRLRPDLVFCPAQRDRYLALLNELRKTQPAPPVVVVSRVPEVAEWLDAMEAGASDYCTAPFEPAHIAWILESNIKAPADPLYRAAG